MTDKEVMTALESVPQEIREKMVEFSAMMTMLDSILSRLNPNAMDELCRKVAEVGIDDARLAHTGDKIRLIAKLAREYQAANPPAPQTNIFGASPPPC